MGILILVLIICLLICCVIVWVTEHREEEAHLRSLKVGTLVDYMGEKGIVIERDDVYLIIASLKWKGTRWEWHFRKHRWNILQFLRRIASKGTGTESE